MIIEKRLKGFDNKLLYDKLNYPQCSCGACPRFFFNSLHVGARGSGKTYTVVQMIKHYEKHKIIRDGVEYKLRTHLISPTIQANEIYQSFDSLDMKEDSHDNYSDQLLLLYKSSYEKFLKTPESKYEKLYETNPEIFNILEEYDYIHPREFKHDPPKVNIIILDDLLGSNAFTRKTQSVLTNAMIKNRHMQIVFCVLVQSIRAVPKTIRMNCSVFQLARFGSKKVVLSDIYEEVSNVIGIDEFEMLYDHATSAKYGSLIIDTTNEKRFLSNFDYQLFFDNKIKN